MLPNQQDEFFAFLQRFFSMRYSVHLDEISLSEWWVDLRNFKFRDIENAFVNYRKDVKLGTYAPKVSQILKFLQGKEFRPPGVHECGVRGEGTRCDQPGKYRVSDSEPVKYFCILHYDERREKGDLDQIREGLTNQFIDEAKSLGISNRELFKRKNPRVYGMLNNVGGGKTIEETKAKRIAQVMNYAKLVNPK